MKRRLLVELDTLLDTRLATLIRMDDAEAANMIAAGYRDRTSDDWSKLSSKIDQQAYTALYDARDGDTLSLAKLTGIAPILMHLTHEFSKARIQLPIHETTHIDVNFYPYQCTDAVKEAILESLQYFLDTDVTLGSVQLPLEAMTPTVIDRQWDGLIMYDINAWLVLHQAALLEKRLPTILMMAPTILHNETEDPKITGLSPFAALEMVLVEYISLRFMDTRYFSVIDLND